MLWPGSNCCFGCTDCSLGTAAERRGCRAPSADPLARKPLDLLGLTDPATEVGLEVLGQLQPSRSGDADPLLGRRQILGNGPALVLTHRPASLVDQLRVVDEVKW